MTDQAEPGRPPAHDLAAFDLAKRSPEQLAQSFARWKAQRKRSPAAARAEPAGAGASAESAVESGAARHRAVAAERLRSVQYSDRFSELLAAGSEPTVHAAERPPIVVARPSLKRPASPRHQLRTLTILAGVASILALAAGALLELSDWRRSPQAEPVVVRGPASKAPPAAPILAAALGGSAVGWTLQRTVDLALMKATPPVQRTPEPTTPKVETASKAVASGAPGKSVSQPAFREAAPETVQFVAKPFVPSAAPTPNAVPSVSRTAATHAPAAATMFYAGDPRPDVLFQHGREQRNEAPGNRATDNRMASGVGKAAPAGSTKTAIEARPAAARSAKTVSGDGDPRGEGSGGARIASDSGGETAGGSGAGDEGGNTAASDGGPASTGGTGGGMGDANTGDSGAAGGDADNGTAGSSDAGGAGAGSGGDNTGGDPGDGGAGSSNGEGENSGGIGGAVGGAVDGVGDALGGALGGDGNPDSNKDPGD